MTRRLGYATLLLGVALAAAAGLLDRAAIQVTVDGTGLKPVAVAALAVAAVLAITYGLYRLSLRAADRLAPDKRRRHDLGEVLQLAFTLAAIVASLGVLTRQWIGLLFSLGIVGFAITYALQQPLFSLVAWVYIMLKRPYQVGDRVAIEDSKGDVIAVDFFVTTLWEIDGDMVSTNQPSGRLITLPNSVVLSSHVRNYSWEDFPYVWNELMIQVAYETDLAFAREIMIEEADAHIGDEMATRIERYRDRLAETPVELEVNDRPSVNVRQEGSWIELRLRYLVHPRRATRVRNALYERILDRMNEHPDRVSFPVGRSR